jgi:outer membrane protein TolC
MMYLRWLTTIVLGVLVAPFLQAQSSLSLAEAIKLGLERNYGILIEKRNVEISNINNNPGQAGALPVASITLGQGNVFTNVVNPAAFLQGTILNNNILPGAAVEWILFDGFRIRTTRERLANIELQASGNERIVIENTVQDIMLAYYSALLARERLDILTQNMRLSRDRYEYMQLKRDVGSAVITDVLLEKTNYLADSSSYTNQQLVYRNAFRELNRLIGETDINKTYQLSDSLIFDDTDYSYNKLREKMFANNINLRTQYISQEIIKNDVELRKAATMPRVSFNAAGSYNTNRQDLSQARFPDGRAGANSVARTQNYNAGINVLMPIYNGGQIKQAIATAKVSEKIGELVIDDMKLALDNDLAQTYDLYNVRRQLVKIAIENKVAAKTNLELTAEKFRTGAINSFDYRVLQNNYLDIAFSEVQAIFNLMESRIRLMRLTSSIVGESDSL